MHVSIYPVPDTVSPVLFTFNVNGAAVVRASMVVQHAVCRLAWSLSRFEIHPRRSDCKLPKSTTRHVNKLKFCSTSTDHMHLACQP